jgi:hypothetical protein
MAPFVVEDRTLQPVSNLIQELSRTERLQQLERIVASSHFRNSKRYPSFLRYVVEHTVEEDSEVLKERNLGVEIFGRSSDYDTNSDPIVRVTAGEVRKRIAQYYQTPGHENELRIDLPVGSYVPHFYPAHHSPVALVPSDPKDHLPAHNSSSLVSRSEQSPPETAEPGPLERSRWIWKRRPGVAVLLIMAVVAFLVASCFALTVLFRDRSRQAGTRYLWQPFISAGKPALIVLGVHSLATSGKAASIDAHSDLTQDARQSALYSMEETDMVPLTDIVSYSKLTDLLTHNSLKYRTQGATDATLEGLRAGPVILIGGFDNIWTMRLTSALRYRLIPTGPNVNAIVDSEDSSKRWLFNNLQPALSNSQDYAIVASYYDTTIEQHVVIAAGIGKNGTVAAAEFLTTDKDLDDWFQQAKVPRNKNIELVLSTEVLDGEPGPPHVIAYTAW